MYGIVFKTKNLSNGKLYIGQTTTRRKDYIGSGKCFKCAVKKHGKESFKRINLKSCNCQEDLDFWEKQYIKIFNSLFPNGYNLNLGGNGVGEHSEEVKRKISEATMGKKNHNFGKIVSKETRKKMSVANKDYIFTEEHRKNLSESMIGEKNHNFGKPRTEETKRKLREVNLGKKLTEETKKKMSVARRKYLKYKGK